MVEYATLAPLAPKATTGLINATLAPARLALARLALASPALVARQISGARSVSFLYRYFPSSIYSGTAGECLMNNPVRFARVTCAPPSARPCPFSSPV